MSENVRHGILGEKIIDPHFNDGRLNGQKYVQFLTSLLEDVPLYV
jgi:hypothetical protein